MLNRINVTIGVLAVVALVSFFSLLDTVGAVNLRTNLASVLGISGLAPIEDDLDGDGLPNADESYWQTDFQNPDTDGDGFLDGEETKSGHDPLMAGPNDVLPIAGNLTEKFSNLSVSGLYEGSLRKDDPEFESNVVQLTSLIVDDGLKDISSGVDINDIDFIPTTRSAEERYIVDVSAVIETFITFYVNELKDFDGKLESAGSFGLNDSEVSSYFKSKARETSSQLDLALKIKVPEAWKDEHVSLISIINQVKNSNEVIATGEKDPIKAAIGFSQIIALFDKSIDVVSAYRKKVDTRGLENVSSLFVNGQ